MRVSDVVGWDVGKLGYGGEVEIPGVAEAAGFGVLVWDLREFEVGGRGGIPRLAEVLPLEEAEELVEA